MKTKLLFISTLLLGFTLGAQSTDAPSIAVASPYVNNLTIKPESAAKMMRLELIKMAKYKVYDEFDMADVLKVSDEFRTGCFGQRCLGKMGQELKVDFVACGSFDGLGNKIVVSVKIVDVKNQSIFKSSVKEFDNQEFELQRMIEIVLKEMNGISVDKVLSDKLSFKNEVITSNNVGKINNSGPRVGVAVLTGSLNEFATRSEDQGGLGIAPAVSMIGYQLEGQYVGTENFSALIEGIVNVSGLEQCQFITSITIMNGFRFGKGGWEFAFGPGFSVKTVANGFFDKDNNFGTPNRYFSESDWDQYALDTYGNDPAYQVNGFFQAPSATSFNSSYNYNSYLDRRGTKKINTSFVFAFGRTFRAGALNIPVNLFYSSQKGGGYAGVNVGFNVQKSKQPINKSTGRY